MTENILQPTPHRILSVRRHTAQEYTFRVETDTVPDFGQFYMLSLPKVGEAPISASGRGDGWAEFTIRSTGVVTSAIFDLVPGNALFLRGPYGNSFPEKDFEGKDLLVVCGGTGMSPVLTLLEHFYHHPELVKSVNVIAGFKDHNAVLFREEIERFKTRFNMIPTLDNEDWPGFRKGMVTAHIPGIPIRDWEDYNIVIVGPPVMMRFAALECLKGGAEEEKIWVSFERKMSCGVGKCGHCKICGTYVCLEGPVFNYKAVSGKLID